MAQMRRALEVYYYQSARGECAYLPRTGMIERARYIVPTSRELEDRDHREAIVWQVLGTRGSD